MTRQGGGQLAVAGVQLDCLFEDPAKSMNLAAPLLEAAATGLLAAYGSATPRLLVLPELFATGFSMQAQAMAAHHGAIADFCRDQAQRLGVHLLAGLVEPGSPRPRNCAALFGPDGAERGRYRKRHLFGFGGETGHYAPGTDALPVFDLGGVRVRPLICYDLRFVEEFRAIADETDLYCVLANWPEPRWEHWAILLRARAIECQAYVLGVNRVGEGGGLRYRGDSALIGPFGELLSTASAAPTLVLGLVDVGEVAAVRARTGFLRDRWL